MKQELVKILPYDKIDFRWISSHYDVHLNGSCMLDGILHEFKNDYPDDDEEMMVRIYKLDLISKIKWYCRQWIFEKCVGYHWTYSNVNRVRGFYYRNPKWFYVCLYNLYYKKINKWII